MSATYRLFTRWRIAKKLKNDSQASLAIGISRQTVQNWKEGRNGEPEYIEKMASDLGEDPVKTILEAYAEQKTGKSAKVLDKLSKRFGAIAAVALLFGMAATYPGVSHAGFAPQNSSAGVYIMRSLAKRQERSALRRKPCRTRRSLQNYAANRIPLKAFHCEIIACYRAHRT